MFFSFHTWCSHFFSSFDFICNPILVWFLIYFNSFKQRVDGTRGSRTSQAWGIRGRNGKTIIDVDKDAKTEWIWYFSFFCIQTSIHYLQKERKKVYKMFRFRNIIIGQPHSKLWNHHFLTCSMVWQNHQPYIFFIHTNYSIGLGSSLAYVSRNSNFLFSFFG